MELQRHDSRRKRREKRGACVWPASIGAERPGGHETLREQPDQREQPGQTGRDGRRREQVVRIVERLHAGLASHHRGGSPDRTVCVATRYSGTSPGRIRARGARRRGVLWRPTLRRASRRCLSSGPRASRGVSQRRAPTARATPQPQARRSRRRQPPARGSGAARCVLPRGARPLRRQARRAMRRATATTRA